ncbi:MAG: hypothetical protein HFE46_04955 [Clostridia bacterium]|nr:hypothetical protein [Clostridia bacterium]
MNAKQLKYLSVFENMAKADIASEQTVKKYFPSLLNLDYAFALDTWEYICTDREDKLIKNAELGLLFGGTVFELFYKKAAAKTVKALSDLPVLRRAVFQYCSAADKNAAFSVMVDLLSNVKTAPAEEFFKCLVKNERIAYGPFMKTLLERVFIELMKKNPAKKMEMPRKLGTLLLAYIAKIKTDEKAMLEQRVRETL